MYKVTQLIGSSDQRLGSRDERAAVVSAIDGIVAYAETQRSDGLGLELEDVPYSGSLEFWFEELNACLAFADHQSVQQALWRSDPGLEPPLITTAHVVLGSPEQEPVTEGLKGIFVFRRRADLSIPEFQTHWLETHGPIAARTPHTSRYVQCHVLPSCYAQSTPTYDGITELYWDTLDDAGRAMASDSMTVEQSADAQNFVADGSVGMFIVASNRLV
jgi:uncharacterized protein (TIGR02118 family)